METETHLCFYVLKQGLSLAQRAQKYTPNVFKSLAGPDWLDPAKGDAHTTVRDFTATHCNKLHATQCNTLQHTAPHCNTL